MSRISFSQNDPKVSSNQQKNRSNVVTRSRLLFDKKNFHEFIKCFKGPSESLKEGLGFENCVNVFPP